LISSAGDTIAGFDPETGERIWWVFSGGEGVVPSPVIGDGVVYSSSGFPTPIKVDQPLHAALRAFKLGGHGDVTKENFLWEQKKNPPMIPSVLLKDDLIYSVKEDGRSQCLQAKDGRIVWEKRLMGTYDASPIWADGKVYFTNDDADTTVIEAGRTFKQVAFNEIGEPCQASMAVSEGRLFLRTQHGLYCISKQ
jgi:outer membrane protein assembly factor BamB